MIDLWFPSGVAHFMIGGLCIGAAVGLLYMTTGLIGGMSTLFSAIWSYGSNHPFFQQERLTSSREWRLAYAAGLIIGVALWQWLSDSPAWQTAIPAWRLLLGGFIAGFGARLANGCTSGHGICGLASLQWPSLFAVLTFMTVAIITAQLTAALGGV